MKKEENLSSFLQDIIHQFYETGQRDPEMVIEALRNACSQNLPVFLNTDGDTTIPEGWAAARTDECPGVPVISLPELLHRAQQTPFCHGVILNPGPEPLYLSMDIIDVILEDYVSDSSSENPSISSGTAAAVITEDIPTDTRTDSDAKAISIEDLIRQGDFYHDPDGEYDIHKAYECYKRAYDLACLEKDLYVYPEVCLRLAEHYPERYSHEELLALLDETILYFGIRVNAGDEAAPALMVRAQRVREQATIRQARKMVIRRYIV